MKQLFIMLMFLCSVNISAQEKKYDGYDPQRGFKMFAEGGYGLSSGLFGEERVSFMASVGYYFNSHIFAGIGSGENYFAESKKYAIPIYANFRLNILNNSISPFLDMKVGGSIGDIKGFYMSPSVGARWAIDNIIVFTTSIGYEFQRTDN